jgi:hypothetical protein
MTGSAIVNVLGILRLLRNNPAGLTISNSVYDHLVKWVGNDLAINVAKVCAYVLETVQLGRTQIETSPLADEAKEGLLQAIAGLENAFQYNQIQQPVAFFFPALDSSISQFAILISAWGMPSGVADTALINSLVSDMEALLAEINGLGLDPAVERVAKRHIAVLLSLLRNVDALGPDAALAAYYELVVRLRRAEATSSSATSEKAQAGFWDRVKTWCAGLTTLSDGVDKGLALIAKAEKLAPLLPHLGI